MTLRQSFWLALLTKALNWIAKNAKVSIYSSPTPIGKRLGGHDIPQVQNSYLIVDVSLAGRTIILGHFQYS